MTFRGTREGHKSARELTFFVEGAVGGGATMRDFHPAPFLPSSLPTPRIITLQFYEPSCPT
jgi:hypothetical protein